MDATTYLWIVSMTKCEEVERFVQAIERANATSYGLAAGILTKDLQNALQFSQRVQAGSIWVNCYDHTVAHVRTNICPDLVLV